jgi:hypothetical protein
MAEVKTTLDIFPYDQATVIETSASGPGGGDCLDLLFQNQGTATAYINGFPLVTNATISWNCNVGETLNVKVNLTFDPGGVNKCYMVRRRIIK